MGRGEKVTVESYKLGGGIESLVGRVFFEVMRVERERKMRERWGRLCR